MVAAPVNARAPNAPITNPSKDSLDDRWLPALSRRTTQAGSTISTAPPNETIRPTPSRFSSTNPAEIGML